MLSSQVKYKGKVLHAFTCILTMTLPLIRGGLILSLSKNIKNSTVNYDWIIKKRQLHTWLTGMVFDHNADNTTIPQLYFDTEKIIKVIQQSIISCYKVIPSEPTRIFVFPTFREFTRKRMSGTRGFAPCYTTRSPMKLLINWLR